MWGISPNRGGGSIALVPNEAEMAVIDRMQAMALMTKRGGAQASLVAFDLLRLEGDDQRLRPIEARDALMRLVDGVSGILFSEALVAEGGGVRQGVQAQP